MQLIVISDTHLESPKRLPRALLKAMEGADQVIHCGDFRRDAVFRFLETRFPLEAVQGNRDDPGICSVLPEKKTIGYGSITLGLVHGWGSPYKLAHRVLNLFQQVDLILFGHSHVPFHGKINNTVLFNPGTATGFALKLRRTYGRIELSNGRIRCEILPVDRS